MSVHADWSIYAAHGLFWAAFGLTRAIMIARSKPDRTSQPTSTATSSTAPHSRALLLGHALAFGVMYFGLGAAVLGRAELAAPMAQRVTGTLVIAAGAALVCWALAHFESWRLLARVDPGHRLATGGPFRYLRHPIYMGLDLLALGSAIWVQTGALWAAVVLMFIGGDVRARAEEKLLARVFGAAYGDYCQRTSRFVPGVY